MDKTSLMKQSKNNKRANHPISKLWLPVMVSIFALTSMQGCISVRSSHGYVLERGTTDLTAKTGLDTKESIIAKYGEPSIISTFSTNSWYYLSSTDQTRAFLKPNTKTRRVVAFHFDDEGKVSGVEDFDLDDGNKVNLVSRATRTRGKELTFWEQLLGSVGQLPLPGADAQTGPGGRPQ